MRTEDLEKVRDSLVKITDYVNRMLLKEEQKIVPKKDDCPHEFANVQVINTMGNNDKDTYMCVCGYVWEE